MYLVLWILIVTAVRLSSSQLQYRVDYRWNYADNTWNLEPRGNWYYYSNNHEGRNDVPVIADASEVVDMPEVPTISNTGSSKHAGYGPLLFPYPNFYRFYRCKCQKCSAVYPSDYQNYRSAMGEGLKMYQVEGKINEPEYNYPSPDEMIHPSYDVRKTFSWPIVNSDQFPLIEPLVPVSTRASEFPNNNDANNINYYETVNYVPSEDLSQISPSSVDLSTNEREKESKILNERSLLLDNHHLQLSNELTETQNSESPTEELEELLTTLNRVLNNFAISVEIKQATFRYPKDLLKSSKAELN